MVDTTSDVIKLGPKLAIKNDKANGKDGGAPVNEHLVTELGEMLEMAKGLLGNN